MRGSKTIRLDRSETIFFKYLLNYCAENISFIPGHPCTFSFAFVIFIVFTLSFLNISALDFEFCEPVKTFVYIENLCSKGYLKDVFLVPLASSNLIDPLFTR